MDFALTDSQKTVVDLAGKIFKDRLTQEQLRAVERSASRTDDALWGQLAAAGLLGVGLPDDVGGNGDGLLELCALLATAGAAAAPVPLWAVLVTGAAPIARFGSDAQKKALLPGIVAGTSLVAAALLEPAELDARVPGTVARRQGDGWRLTGVKTGVPVAGRASRLLVPARVEGGDAAVFIVDPKAAGVAIEAQTATSGELQGQVTLRDAVAEDVLGGVEQGPAVLDWLVDRATVGLCAVELGIVEQVLRMTASYTAQRVQFDRPIATFQAVAQRAADAYIDVETIRLTLWEAAWRLEQGLPAAREIAIAKYWASDGGQRVTYAAQHLHGGMGYDLEYPLARYYPMSKQIELTLGGAHAQLARMGALMAAE
jgi:alkylation response protein AidB-like acyl-CoA dehydrogenase